jgi:ribonuclease HI
MPRPTSFRVTLVIRTASGKQANTSSHEMELRALIEAAELANGPCTIISDHEGIVRIARQEREPHHFKQLWQELYATIGDKEVMFEWQRRGESLGQRLGHQLARDAAKRR